MRSNKKGFTIVELVIVIAVIAILAAVLIPTIAGLVRKANISADTVVAKQLNNAIATQKVDTFEDALAVLRENGYLIANLNAKADQCYFAWDATNKQIVLVDAKNGYEIIYKNKDVDEANLWYAVSDPAIAKALKEAGKNVKNTIANIDDLKATISSVSGAVTIYMDESVIVDETNVIKINNAAADITIDLGSSSIAGNNNGTPKIENIPFLVEEGNLTIKGGVIQSTGDWYDSDGDLVNTAIIAESGVLNIDSSKIDCPNSNILVAYAGANGTVSDAVINANSSAINVGGGSEVTVKNCTVNVNNEAIWVSNSGGFDSKVTVESGTFNGVGNTIATYGGTLIIEDGEFNSEKYNLFKFYYTESNITIKGGTFNGIAFEDLTADILKGMFSTSSYNYANISVTKDADGNFVITN